MLCHQKIIKEPMQPRFGQEEQAHFQALLYQKFRFAGLSTSIPNQRIRPRESYFILLTN
jgi:hypothetical protein